MIAFEVALLFVLALISVVTIAAVGRPLAEAYAEKLKTRYRAIGSQEAYDLKERQQNLETEMIELKSQIKTLQENNEYAIKLLESER